MPGKATKLLEVRDWTATSTTHHAYQCLDELRRSDLWRIHGVANYLADECLGVVPADGELFALEPGPHELDSCFIDYQALLGMYALNPRSLMRGMPFMAIYADSYGRLCLCSMRDAALWKFPDDVTVELGMDVRRLGEIRSVADIPWARPLLDVAEVRATLGVQDLVRHADCHRLERAVPVADWLAGGTGDDDVLLEWACSAGHVNEVRGGVLRSKAVAQRSPYLGCTFCPRMRRDHRPDDNGLCRFHRVFVRPKAESGGADGAGDSSERMGD